jgi:hypothetical protein
MRKSTAADARGGDAITQWGRVCDESLKRYFDTTRSLSAAALKSQCALLDATGEMLVAGNKVVAENFEQLTNGEGNSKTS